MTPKMPEAVKRFEGPGFFKEYSKKELDWLQRAAVKIARYARRQKVDCLIGNDVRGRGAALLVKLIYDKMYGAPIKLYFIRSSGLSDLDLPKIAENAVPGTKALFIDECARTGRSVRNAKQAFESKNVNLLAAVFDVHGKRIMKPYADVDYVGRRQNLFVAQYVKHFPHDEYQHGIYVVDKLTGIIKFTNSRSSIARMLRRTLEVGKLAGKETPEDLPERIAEIQGKVNEYRENLKTLANQAVEKYGKPRQPVLLKRV